MTRPHVRHEASQHGVALFLDRADL